MRGQGSRGRALGAVVWASVLAAGCVDLFHSTDFGSCTGDGCTEAGTDAGRLDATRDTGRDATRDAAIDGAKLDGTTTHDAGRGDARDASSNDTGHVGDAGDGAALDAGHDSGPPPTDFCGWSLPEVQAHATHACEWLSACQGPTGFYTDFAECYSSALLAYGCAFDPGQRVIGSLHAYWDALWQVESCADVASALFPQGVPTCTGVSTALCAAALADGGYPDIAVQCNEAGAPPTGAQNCATVGYTCITGGCGLPDAIAHCPDASTEATSGACAGTIMHLCAVVPNFNGPDHRYDIGYDCRGFGAGACEVTDGGLAGCKPADAGSIEDAGSSCALNPLTTCSDGGHYAFGCATGRLEVVDCSGLGGQCGFFVGHAPQSTATAYGCFNQLDGIAQCLDGGFIEFPALGNSVQVDCNDAGLGQCQTVNTEFFACSPPPQP